MSNSMVKNVKKSVLVRELATLFEKTHDKRFSDAIEAVVEHLPGSKRGAKTKWDDFSLMILWIRVQTLVRAKGLTVSAACRKLASSPVNGPWKKTSKGRFEARYYEAVKMFEADPQSRQEADADVGAFVSIAKR
jgi:hypothetical protein